LQNFYENSHQNDGIVCDLGTINASLQPVQTGHANRIAPKGHRARLVGDAQRRSLALANPPPRETA
jgi:hypothetical protein